MMMIKKTRFHNAPPAAKQQLLGYYYYSDYHYHYYYYCCCCCCCFFWLLLIRVSFPVFLRVISEKEMFEVSATAIQCWNCRRGWGWTPSSCLQTLIFEWKSALNFNPWAKFQTFRHLTPSSFRSISTLAFHRYLRPFCRQQTTSKPWMTLNWTWNSLYWPT